MFNARAETLSSSPAFRDALRRKRCLVPVDGFYEWKREGTRRQPFLIARTDGRPLALAGLWSGWRDPAADRVIRTFTIVTAGPNAQVAELHDRMPVVVPEEAWSTWLDPHLEDSGELQGLLQPNEAVDLRILAVSRLVNDVRNDGPELIEPASEEPAALEAAVAPGLFD
jgi:putative SOS response-associated peptidase YedK